MHRIYISHRHDDAPECARRLYDRLIEFVFGFGSVIGADFEGLNANHKSREATARTVGSCRVLLVIIGRGWFGGESAGRSAFDDPHDLVRVEIAAALAGGIRVIPVLVDGARMPRGDQLPDVLVPLARLQAIELSRERWDQATTELLRTLFEIDDSREDDVPAAAAPPQPASAGLPKHSSQRFILRNRAPRCQIEYDVEMDSGVAPRPPEPVLLGASAPASAAPGEEFSARFVAYIQEEEEQVLDVLTKLSPRATSHPALKTCRWRVGTLVQVTLGGKWLQVGNPVQEFVWQGSQALLDFDVQVADDAPEGTTLLKFDVAIDGVVVAPIRIDLGLGKSARQGAVNTVSVEAARTAFASYASADRARVLDRVAAVRISAGLDVFLDCLSLHPGEEWKPRLADQIRSRDLFLLFWSAAAAESEWVTWEWRTALTDKRKDVLQVHPLESGIMPPEPLKDLHFGDFMMLIRDATAKGAGGNA
jgi:hypothetical protein